VPSVTWWNRLEPRPRSTDITDALAARVRDPAFLLMRQWQFGEFRGEDAGSPSYIGLEARHAPAIGWRVPGGSVQDLPPGVPLEELIETEGFGSDLGIRVELGQTFEALLGEHQALPATLDAFRSTAAFKINLDPEPQLASDADQERARFQRVCAGRAIDGIALYDAMVLAWPTDPDPVPLLPNAEQLKARGALADFKLWIEEVFDAIGTGDAPAWRPERLSYDAEVIVTKPSGGTAVLAASPGREADFDWFAFDERPAASTGSAAPVAITPVKRSVLPGHVRFRGMPNHRFWDFESGETAFGSVMPDTRDLAKMLVIDFMLVQGNDWFVLPLDQPVGTLCRIDSLVVHDVFGGATLVERADAVLGGAGERWTMFSTTIEGDSSRVADYLVLSASAATTTELGAAVEEIHFLRDEMANMAWAVEHTTENGVGEAWRGHERDLAVRAVTGPPAPSPDVGVQSPVPIRYQVQTAVPEHWIPLVPVAIDPVSGQIALEPGAMVRTPGGNVIELVTPHGRVLRPSNVPSNYRIREEEISGVGTRITRVVCRSRWTDGSTHLWIARRRTAGAGEGSSGLMFDLAVPSRAP